MSRLEATFARLKEEGKTGLVTYVTAGDPDLPATAAILRALATARADVLEVGVPFSDPLADGPVIQRASERALARGTTLADVLAIARDLRHEAPAAGLIAFSYFNPLLRHGLEKFCKDAAAAGLD